MIDEKKLIEKIEKMFVPLSTPDGSESIDIAINGYNECLVDVLETIKEQPKVGEWIPVEERLPEIFENVLIYTKSGHYHIGAYFEERKRWWLGVYWEDLDFILAWTPLPKPYRGPLEKDSKRLEKTRKEKRND